MYSLMIACAAVATVFVLIWLYLYFKYRNQFDEILEDVDGSIFTLKDLYFIGLGAIDVFEKIQKKKISSSEKALERMKKLSEVFGRNNAELYYYVSQAGTLSLVLTFVPAGLMLTCLMQSLLGLGIGAVLAFILPYGLYMGIDSSVDSKKDAILSEFPKMVSKLTMLVNAGMLVRRAWDEVANSNHEEALYEEMRITSKDIQEGMAIDRAMESFASRCGIKEIRKFSSIYVQAVNRGASESINSMKIMADEAWEQKKQLSKQKGEIASQKLLIPNMLMFVGIMVVVVVPMIASMLSGFNL